MPVDIVQRMTFRSLHVLWVSATLLAIGCRNPSVPGISTPTTQARSRRAAPKTGCGARCGRRACRGEPDQGPDEAVTRSTTPAKAKPQRARRPPRRGGRDDAADRRGRVRRYLRAVDPAEYEVSISSENWAAIYTEFKTRYDEETGGGQPRTEYPISFRYGDEVVSDATLRLKGSRRGASQRRWIRRARCSSLSPSTASLRARGFTGSGRSSWTCRGRPHVPAPAAGFRISASRGNSRTCANSARLYVNGIVLWLYANTERMDKTFLSRVFPGAAGGDLWTPPGAQTNELTATWDRRECPVRRHDLDAIDGLVDLQQASRSGPRGGDARRRRLLRQRT